MKKIICLLLALAALAMIGGALAESYEVPAPWELSTGYTQDDAVGAPEDLREQIDGGTAQGSEGFAQAGRSWQSRDATTVDLTPVINAAVGLLGEILITVITLLILPPLKRWLLAHTSKDQQDKFLTLVRELVLAAEQIFVKQGMGSDKMDWVIGQLKARGYDADVPMIEAAVHNMNMGVLQVFESKLGTVVDPPDEPPVIVDEFD